MATGIADIRIRAERFAYDEIEALRMSVLGVLGDSPSVSGWMGKALRDKVEQTIKVGIAKLTADSRSYLQEAWTEGINRATKEFSRQVPNLPHSSIASEVQGGIDVIRLANTHTEAGLTKVILIALSRASLPDGSIEQVLKRIRDKSSSGIFDFAKQQAAGTLSEEVTVLEARAHDLRSRELEKFIALQKRAGILSKTKGTDKLLPVTVRIWRHKPIGSQNQPRPNHVAMDWMCVVFDSSREDIPFHLIAKSGVVYHCLGPKLPPLPVGETANCGCSVAHKVIWVTSKRRDELIQRSTATGGFPFTEAK